MDPGVELLDSTECSVRHVKGSDGGWGLQVPVDEGGEHGLGHFAGAEECYFGEDVGGGGGGGEEEGACTCEGDIGGDGRVGDGAEAMGELTGG